MKEDKSNYKIRLAKLGDVSNLYRTARADLGEFSWFNKDSLIKNVKEEPNLCFVMEHENDTKGAIFFRQEWNDVVWCWLIFVSKEMRGRGTAKHFEKGVMRLLKGKYRIIYLEVDESNTRMLRWCRKNNYSHVCKFPDWFGKGKHAIIFRKDIK